MFTHLELVQILAASCRW